MFTMKTILNGHALRSLLKPVEKPNVNLGVSNDENHKSIPLLIFNEQHLPIPKPEIQPLNQIPYESIQKCGSGNILSIEDFETQTFDIGHPYGFGGV